MKLLLFFVLVTTLFQTVIGGSFFFVVVFTSLFYLIVATTIKMRQGFSWRNELPNAFRVFLVSLGAFTHQFLLLGLPLVLVGFLFNDEAMRRLYRNKGVIVLSGVDGTGKSTHAQNIKSWVERKGLKCNIVRFHKYLLLSWRKKNSGSLVAVVGGKSRLSFIRPYVALLDNIVFYLLCVLPHVASGECVVCDRFVWGNYVKHKALGYPTRFMFWLATLIRPRATVILDVSAETSYNRVIERHGHLIYSVDQIEVERAEFRRIAYVFGYPIVKAEGSKDQTWRVLKTVLERRGIK